MEGNYSISRFVGRQWVVLDKELPYSKAVRKYGKEIAKILTFKYANSYKYIKRIKGEELLRSQILDVKLDNEVHNNWRMKTIDAPEVPYYVSTQLLAKNVKYWFSLIMRFRSR